jgi:RNA polymerase sigma-B factor
MARKSPKFQMNRAQQRLAADNLNLARREAWRQQRITGICYSTLESVAFVGLCKAAYRYDPKIPHPETGKSMKFSSFAVPTIRGELMHWVRDSTYALRLTHKMRERWVKGRKLLYRGFTDIEVAEALEISIDDWIEVRSVCSGPPLELKEQAKPTEALEASEVDFGQMYLDLACKAIDEMEDDDLKTLSSVDVYLSGTGTRVPRESIDKMLISAGCHTTDWDKEDIKVLEGWEDLSNGRMQGVLF